MSNLTETRKADRAKMAAILAQAVTAAGAVSAEIKPEDPSSVYDKRRTRVEIVCARGLLLTVTFRGDSPQSRPNIFVLSWHTDLDSDARLADVFGYDGVNPYHFSKATQIAEGLDDLVAKVTRIVAMAADGSAFSPEREAAMIAKDGTAAQRRARFQRWADDVAAKAQVTA